MKLIILAAGKGTRLLPITKSKPKPLVKIKNNKNLLEFQIQNSIKTNIFDEIIIITGYLSNKIEKIIENYKSKINIKTIYNPFYDISGPIVSLWVANFLMLNDDFAISNGDTLFKEGFFKQLKSIEKKGISIIISKKENINKDDMEVIINNNFLEKVSKNKHKENKTSYVSSGFIFVCGKNNRNLFRNQIINRVKNENVNDKTYWHSLLNDLNNEGIDINIHEVDYDLWNEIDNKIDLHKTKKFL